MEWSEIKRFILYSVLLLASGFCFCCAGPYLLKESIRTWSKTDYNVLLVGDFIAESPINEMPIKDGFLLGKGDRHDEDIKFNTDIISVDEGLVDQANPISETDTKMLNDQIKDRLITHISGENVVAIVTASTSQTISACLEVGKMFNIPVLVTAATETDCLQSYGNIGIGYRLVANNKLQVSKMVQWVNQMTALDASKMISPTGAWSGFFEHSTWADSLKNQLHKDSSAILKNRKFFTKNGIAVADTLKKLSAHYHINLNQLISTHSGNLIQARKDSVENFKTIGILYMSTKYGENLCKELKDTLRTSGYKVIAFPISSTNNIIYAMQQTQDELHINKWIAICYENEAVNIVSMQERIKALCTDSVSSPGLNRILFSEAAYGTWIRYHNKDTMLYVSHDDNFRISQSGLLYSEVAEDAYHILDYCLTNIETTAKADLINRLTTLPTDPTSERNWHRGYAFGDNTGENSLSSPQYCRFDSLNIETFKPNRVDLHAK